MFLGYGAFDVGIMCGCGDGGVIVDVVGGLWGMWSGFGTLAKRVL